MERLIQIREVSQRTGNRRPRSIYNDLKDGRFPKPFKIGRSTYWRELDIDLFFKCGCDMQRFEAAKAGEAVSS
ncbi:MAG: AlpA family phage regulatory protein [Planctomycetota bacterium]